MVWYHHNIARVLYKFSDDLLMIGFSHTSFLKVPLTQAASSLIIAFAMLWYTAVLRHTQPL